MLEKRRYRLGRRTIKLGTIMIVLVCLAFATFGVSAEKVKIRFMGQAGMPATAQLAFRQRIQRFENLNPNVEVLMQLVGEGEWYRKLINQHAIGDPPALLFAEIEDAATYYYQGLIDPVTPIIERGGPDTFARATRLVIDGEDYFYPVATTPDVLWYREDLFQEKGLEVPTTWDSWIQAIKALTEDTDGDGRIDRWGIGTFMYRAYCTAWWYNLFYGAGGHVMAEKAFENLSAKDITLNSPATRKALEFGKKLFEYSPPGAIQYQAGDYIAAYFTGKIAMAMYEGRLFYYTLEKGTPSIADNTKATWIPTLYGYPRPTPTCVDGYVISSHLKPDQLKYAMEFVYFQSSGENLVNLLMGVPIHNLPATTNPDIIEAWKKEPIISKYWDRVEVLMEASKRSVSYLNEWLTPNPVSAVAVTSLIIPDMMLNYIVGNKSADEVITNAVKRIEELIVSMQERTRAIK